MSPITAGTSFADNVNSASTNQTTCLQRANDYYSWCKISPSSGGTAAATYLTSGVVRATRTVGATGCEIKLSSCPRSPSVAGTPFVDDVNNASSNQATCMQRATDYYGWCGISATSGSTSKATYFSAGKIVQTVTVPTQKSCAFNGKTVPHDGLVTGYIPSVWPYTKRCVAVDRHCKNGVLSGASIAKFGSCDIGSGTACSIFGKSVPHGALITGFKSSSVTVGKCELGQSVCNNGQINSLHLACKEGTSQPVSMDGHHDYHLLKAVRTDRIASKSVGSAERALAAVGIALASEASAARAAGRAAIDADAIALTARDGWAKDASTKMAQRGISSSKTAGSGVEAVLAAHAVALGMSRAENQIEAEKAAASAVALSATIAHDASMTARHAGNVKVVYQMVADVQRGALKSPAINVAQIAPAQTSPTSSVSSSSGSVALNSALVQYLEGIHLSIAGTSLPLAIRDDLNRKYVVDGMGLRALIPILLFASNDVRSFKQGLGGDQADNEALNQYLGAFFRGIFGASTSVDPSDLLSRDYPVSFANIEATFLNSLQYQTRAQQLGLRP